MSPLSWLRLSFGLGESRNVAGGRLVGHSIVGRVIRELELSMNTDLACGALRVEKPIPKTVDAFFMGQRSRPSELLAGLKYFKCQCFCVMSRGLSGETWLKGQVRLEQRMESMCCDVLILQSLGFAVDICDG